MVGRMPVHVIHWGLCLWRKQGRWHMARAPKLLFVVLFARLTNPVYASNLAVYHNS